MRRYKRGFTLIELLVAVAIFATIAVVLYSCLRGGIAASRRIETELNMQQKIKYALDKINRDLKNAVYLSGLPFEGENDRVEFITLTKSSEKAGLNISRVSYCLSGISEGASGRAIIRRQQTIQEALSIKAESGEGTAEEVSRAGEVAQAAPAKEESLLDGVSDIRFGYLEKRKGLSPSDTEDEWVEIWEHQEAIPQAVAVEFTINLFDAKGIQLSRRIYIPAGKPVDKEEGPQE